MKRILALIVLTLTLCGVEAKPAAADTFFTPFAGLTFAGYAEQHKFTFGGAFTFLGDGPWGFDIDLGYTPDFFGESQDFAIIAKSNVTTMTGSLVFGIPINGTRTGSVRPYLTAGFGLLLARLTSADTLEHLSTNDTALTAGAGVIVKVAKGMGLRLDARYFRRLQDPSNDSSLDLSIGHFQFWRATVGFVIGGK